MDEFLVLVSLQFTQIQIKFGLYFYLAGVNFLALFFFYRLELLHLFLVGGRL